VCQGSRCRAEGLWRFNSCGRSAIWTVQKNPERRQAGPLQRSPEEIQTLWRRRQSAEDAWGLSWFDFVVHDGCRPRGRLAGLERRLLALQRHGQGRLSRNQNGHRRPGAVNGFSLIDERNFFYAQCGGDYFGGGFASKVLSHSHRALARWGAARKDVWNRFNGLPLDRLLSGWARRSYVTSQPRNRWNGFWMFTAVGHRAKARCEWDGRFQTFEAKLFAGHSGSGWFLIGGLDLATFDSVAGACTMNEKAELLVTENEQ